MALRLGGGSTPPKATTVASKPVVASTTVASKPVTMIKPKEIAVEKPVVTEEVVSGGLSTAKAPTARKGSAPKDEVDIEIASLIDGSSFSDFGAEFGISKFDNIVITAKTGFDLIDAVLSNSSTDAGLVLRTLNGLLGASGCGKTTLALQVAGKIVSDGDEHSKLFVFDAEKTTTKERIFSLTNLDPRRLMPPIKKDTTVERFYGLIKYLAGKRQKVKEEQGEEFIMNNPWVIVCDSIASMPSEREIAADEDINKAMGTVARLHSALMKLYLEAMFTYNITVIFINQLRDKLTISGAPAPKQLMYEKMSETYPGGKALPFYSFTLARLARVTDLEKEKYGDQAIKVQLNFLKTKNSETNNPINMVFFPKKGYSNFWSNYMYLADTKAIMNSAYCKFTGEYNKLYSASWRLKDAQEKYDTEKDFREVFNHVLSIELGNLVTYMKNETESTDNIEISFGGNE